MKKVLLYLFLSTTLVINAQNSIPIDEISIGLNYTIPDVSFSSSGHKDSVISQQAESKIGYSLGIINIFRKAKPIQFIYGVELNYLSFDYETNYETSTFNPADNKNKGYIIQDNLKGTMNSMMVTVPLIFRYNLIHTKQKIPIFIDAGFKYDFITAYYSEYKMNHYQYNALQETYSKETLEDKTRFYNKRYNLNLTFGVGTILKRTSLKLSYTLPAFALSTNILNYYGEGEVKMNYLNFSVNYKLRK